MRPIKKNNLKFYNHVRAHLPAIDHREPRKNRYLITMLRPGKNYRDLSQQC